MGHGISTALSKIPKDRSSSSNIEAFSVDVAFSVLVGGATVWEELESKVKSKREEPPRNKCV